MILHQSSFKDSHVIKAQGEILRVVFLNYQPEFGHLLNSGLFVEIRENSLIIDNTEVNDRSFPPNFTESLYKITKPVPGTVSYSSEWSFGLPKDAALCTLHILQIAVKYNKVLRDCSAYNTQLYDGSPLLIDTLFFLLYKAGEPWFAYRQFCEHFFEPLLLIAQADLGLSALFNSYIGEIKYFND